MQQYQQSSVWKRNASLEGKTIQEQQKILNDVRDTLISIVLTLLMPLKFLGGLVSWCTLKLVSIFGYNPFEWLRFDESEHNAKFANRASSDPHLFNALMKAGEIFEKANSIYLSKKTRYFNEEVTSTSDATALAESIVTFCKVLQVLNGVPVTLDANDVKSMLAEMIKAVLNSSKAKQEIKETFSTPIAQPGRYAWVKYDFCSSSRIEKCCWSEKKFVEVKVTVLYYHFTNEDDFRDALRQAEQKLAFSNA